MVPHQQMYIYIYMYANMHAGRSVCSADAWAYTLHLSMHNNLYVDTSAHIFILIYIYIWVCMYYIVYSICIIKNLYINKTLN